MGYTYCEGVCGCMCATHTELLFPGLVMGRRWWGGPSFFHVVGRGGPSNLQRSRRGPARPGNFSEDGLRPGPAHRISNYIGPARPGPSILQICRPGPARPMTFAARPMRHGLHMGRPVDLKSRPMGRPTGWTMCYPVLKSANTIR